MEQRTLVIKKTSSLYCSKDAATQEVTSCTCYWSIHSPGKADASGLLSCVSEALKPLGVDNVLAFWGLKTDRCSLEEAQMELLLMLVIILD